MSWYAITFSLAAVIAPLLGGVIYGFDPDMFWYLSNVIGLIVLIGFYLLSASVDSERETTSTRELKLVRAKDDDVTLPEVLESD